MTDIECLQKLSAISGYCCAQKDKDALDYAMAVIKERPHAKWIGPQLGTIKSELDNWKCSNCNQIFGCVDMDWPYCPECGAKMDKGREDG